MQIMNELHIEVLKLICIFICYDIEIHKGLIVYKKRVISLKYCNRVKCAIFMFIA